MRALAVHELKMVIANVIPVSLDLEIDISDHTDFIDPKIFFLEISVTNLVRYINSFLS